MLDAASPIHPGRPIPGTDVEFVRHHVDWEAAPDLAALTEQRLSDLGDSIAHGAWYLSPGYSVHAPSPSADFFRVARHARGRWLRRMRKNLSSHGHRREVREAENQGRRVALLDQSSDDETTTLGHPPEVVHLRDLPPDQRPQARESGLLARRLASSGVLFIDGHPIAPDAWEQGADELLPPKRQPCLTIVNRRVDLDALKISGDLEPLKRLTREALQDHLYRSPELPAYIAAYRTISAPETSAEFYAAAKRCHDTWACLLNRRIGSRNVRRMHREADDPTFTLALSGVLVVDRQLHPAGCWPNQSPKPARLRRNPSNAPTVPPEYLGLIPPNGPNRKKQSS